MNFDKSLRVAMPAASEPAGLAADIQVRISRWAHRRLVRRRVIVTLGATCAAIAALALFPTIRAQATLSRISGALSGAEHMVAKRYTLDAQGHRIYAGFAAFDHGKWLLNGASGLEPTFLMNGRRYVLDPFTKSYVVSDDDKTLSGEGEMGLSGLLRQMSAWNNDVELKTVTIDGQTLTEAIVTSRVLLERLIIYADPQTNLPIKAYGESLELGRWRRGTETEVSYTAAPDPLMFALDPQIPQLSREEWRQKVARTMLGKELSRHTFKKQDLVIRSLDVARDGTVFVSFQSGQNRPGWTGYGFTLRDDLGTVYVQRQMGTSSSPLDAVSRKEGGRIELAVFVPVNRPQAWSPRRLTLSAHIGDKGEFVRLVRMVIGYPDGRQERKWGLNRWGADASDTYKDVPVLVERVERPTCEDRPAYLLAVGHGEWFDALRSDLAKAETRAGYYADRNELEQVRSWLHEQLRLMTAIERLGGVPYSRARVLEKLKRIESRASTVR